MKKLLCPIDFSEAAHNAVAYAAKFAKACGASLTLLHVLEPLKSGAIFKSEKENVAAAILEKLKGISQEIRQLFKVSCDAEVLQSSVPLNKAISNNATDIDMIVMGTDGVADLFDFFMGSHTYNIIRETKIPVMLVPRPCLYSEIKSIVYAYNSVQERKLPLNQLFAWAKILNCNVTILQVMEEGLSQNATDEMKDWQFNLKQQWSKDDTNLRFVSIRSSEIAPSINSYMHRNEDDVLALSTSNESFIKGLLNNSVVKIISEVANYPVLVFHE